jgi:predicted nuclease of predicted toxin-antitoxin system
MRLYLDQMFRVDFAESLRDSGHDVVRASESGLARASDGEILDYAIRDNRILVTLDEHFGDWTVLPLKSHPGVIRLKIHPPVTPLLTAQIIPMLKVHVAGDFADHLVIAGPKHQRWIRTA